MVPASERPLLGLIAAELIGASLVVYATLNERLYGGPTPWSASPPGETATGASSWVDYVERVPRLVTLWVTRGGLLRWAPVFALAFFAGWLLWRSRREHLARVVPARATAEAAAGLAWPSARASCWSRRSSCPRSRRLVRGPPPRAALPVAGALVAWGLRHAPRVGAALGAVTLAASVWVMLD